MSEAGGAPVRMRWRRLEWPGWARRLVAAAFLVLLTALLFAPPSTFKDVHRWFPHEDKVAHAAVFLVLALLVRWSLPGARGRQGLQLAAFAALALYAVSVEALQPLLSARQRLFEWGDLACNCAGTLGGWRLFAAAFAARGDG